MQEVKVDFIVHWLWAVVFGILLITGVTLMGARFGWVMNNYVPLADYLHRMLASLFVLLGLVMIIIEILRASKPKPIKMPWLIINKSALGIFMLVSTLLFTLSGLFLWICKDFSHKILAFSLVIHEVLTFVSLIAIVWHIYDKAYALPTEFGGTKNV